MIRMLETLDEQKPKQMHSADNSGTAVRGCHSVSDPQLRSTVEKIVRRVLDTVLPETGERLVPIEVSARHLHITREDLEKLFGPGYRLTKLRDLNQPGEFASNETVTVVGPKGRTIQNVRILGPIRKATQVELSYTDGVYLGIDLPHRLSGDIRGSAPVVLIGPKGMLELKEGAIRAQRHIHISSEQAARWRLRHQQKVNVQTRGPLNVTFSNVVIRVGENLNLTMHIDTDEANAAGIRSGEIGVIVDGSVANG